MTTRSTVERVQGSPDHSETDMAPAVAGKAQGDGDANRKLVVTLGPEAASATRRMAAQLDVTAPEAVRRGLMLLDLLLSLDPSERLVVLNDQGDIERLRFHWGY
jgi:hypothetical protein